MFLLLSFIHADHAIAITSSMLFRFILPLGRPLGLAIVLSSVVFLFEFFFCHTITYESMKTCCCAKQYDNLFRSFGKVVVYPNNQDIFVEYKRLYYENNSKHSGFSQMMEKVYFHERFV